MDKRDWEDPAEISEHYNQKNGWKQKLSGMKDTKEYTVYTLLLPIHDYWKLTCAWLLADTKRNTVTWGFGFKIQEDGEWWMTAIDGSHEQALLKYIYDNLRTWLYFILIHW